MKTIKKNESIPFYRAFEELFRGPRAVIKKRLEVYLPFVQPLLDHHQPAKILDLGCGRGEWLELMRENGFEVEGIDLDNGMLQACVQLELPVIQGDAIELLKKKADASCSVISAFHVVEHISFEQVNELVAEALRVLKPGGLLILETPNPENLVVATSNFYLDPTHKRPIPPQLLAFTLKHDGFKRTKILRLQESEKLLNDSNPSLIEVLSGASPDYAVVAQKDGPAPIFEATNGAFAAEYGLSMETLAQRYEEQTIKKTDQSQVREAELLEKLGQALATVQQAQALAQQAEARALQAQNKAEQAMLRNEEIQRQLEEALAAVQQAQAHSHASEAELDKTKQELHQVHQANHHHLQLAEARQQQIEALLKSKSWRLTWPLRQIMRGVKWAGRLPVRLSKALLRLLLKVAVQGVLQRQTWRVKLKGWLQKYPRLYARLRQFALYYGLIDTSGGGDLSFVSPALKTTHEVQPDLPSGQGNNSQGLDTLSPHARQIYHDLKAAMDQHRKGSN
ncbi:MAG: class I SAM-dependent methyltransferase [Desulfuromonadales bacterium]